MLTFLVTTTFIIVFSAHEKICTAESDIRVFGKCFGRDLLGARFRENSEEVDREVGSSDTQTVAADQGEDAADTRQVSLRLQPARSQPHLAGDC